MQWIADMSVVVDLILDMTRFVASRLCELGVYDLEPSIHGNSFSMN